MKYLDLKAINALHAEEIHEAVARVIDRGWYLRGEATAGFEAEYARYIGTKHCVCVANGLDALTLILRAYIYNGVLSEGDEVIVPANTYIATILAITENRLRPILVEPDINTLQIDDTLIEHAIGPRTRALMIVHLYGRCAFTPRIADICQRHGLLLVEDNAQAHGCAFIEHSPSDIEHPALSIDHSSFKRTGSLGHAAAHSFYPGKNLGALGDAGAVTTDDDQLADTLRSIANYGSSRKYVFDYIGRNSRIDELQAAVLSVKLRHLDQDNQRRRHIAAYYAAHLTNPAVTIPQGIADNGQPAADNVFHIFPILCQQRDRLQAFLAEHDVQTMIHYPIPPHKQQCYREWHALCLPLTERIHAEELSLPCHQAMTDAEVETVANIIKQFNQ